MRFMRRWENIPKSELASCSLIWSCWAPGNESIIRSIVCEALLVWRVENTKCPVSAAVTAVDMVSGLRISPIIITSTSWRKACLSAV